jgi:hypothetical protein
MNPIWIFRRLEIRIPGATSDDEHRAAGKQNTHDASSKEIKKSIENNSNENELNDESGQGSYAGLLRLAPRNDAERRRFWPFITSAAKQY